MRFTLDAHPALADGSVTVTFRNWKRPQVKVGGRYRVGSVDLVVDAMRQVRMGDLTDADAAAAGLKDLARLRKLMRADADDGDRLVWRIDFHAEQALTRPQPGAQLTDDQVVARLARLDSGGQGPWTRDVLALIGEQPGVVSTTLAAQLGRERFAFKADVRKLKALGLTESLEVGYRLSDRGRSILKKMAGGRSASTTGG